MRASVYRSSSRLPHQRDAVKNPCSTYFLHILFVRARRQAPPVSGSWQHGPLYIASCQAPALCLFHIRKSWIFAYFINYTVQLKLIAYAE